MAGAKKRDTHKVTALPRVLLDPSKLDRVPSLFLYEKVLKVSPRTPLQVIPPRFMIRQEIPRPGIRVGRLCASEVDMRRVQQVWDSARMQMGYRRIKSEGTTPNIHSASAREGVARGRKESTKCKAHLGADTSEHGRACATSKQTKAETKNHEFPNPGLEFEAETQEWWISCEAHDHHRGTTHLASSKLGNHPTSHQCWQCRT